VREWWRWALRGVAVLAMAAGGLLLGLHPTATYHPPLSLDNRASQIPSAERCASPFDRIHPEPRALAASPPPGVGLLLGPAATACNAATHEREHIVEALGIGAVLLVGLSFLPRRREPATKRALEPSPV
jgi:hypothetical protein